MLLQTVMSLVYQSLTSFTNFFTIFVHIFVYLNDISFCFTLGVGNRQSIQGKQQYFTSKTRGKCWRRKGIGSLEIWVINGVIYWGLIPATGRSSCRIKCITSAEDISLSLPAGGKWPLIYVPLIYYVYEYLQKIKIK